MTENQPDSRPVAGPTGPGPRAARTRAAIVETARALFLDLGYAGTSVADITEACGISRAGFYTYFRRKREVFAELGRASYQATLEIVARLGELATSWSEVQVREWVAEYFGYMDVHGAFILAARLSAPTDADFRADSQRTQVRVARMLGTVLHTPSAQPPAQPEIAGLVIIAMLEQAWCQLRILRVPVAEADLVNQIAAIITSWTGTRRPTG
ncbi:MAG: TetR/AcrR family transcriptional regulator [Frankia sp.]|nr:TetR/AcrR family transcriptional regulator [Frankia sp.]